MPTAFQVRIFNLETVKAMRDLNPKDIDTLVSVQGMVVRASGIQPDLKQAFFECSACQHAVTVQIDRGRINEPHTCGQCSAKFSFQLIHNRCLFTDKQVVKMQETPESMPEGEVSQRQPSPLFLGRFAPVLRRFFRRSFALSGFLAPRRRERAKNGVKWAKFGGETAEK